MNLERVDEFELWPDHFQSQGNEPGHGLVIHWPASTFNVSESRLDLHRRLGQMDSQDRIAQVKEWMEQSDKNYQLYLTQISTNAEHRLRIEHLLAENSSLDTQLNVALHDLEELRAEKIAS